MLIATIATKAIIKAATNIVTEPLRCRARTRETLSEFFLIGDLFSIASMFWERTFFIDAPKPRKHFTTIRQLNITL